MTPQQIAANPVLFEAEVLNLLTQMLTGATDDADATEQQLAKSGRVPFRAALIERLQAMRGTLIGVNPSGTPTFAGVQGQDATGTNVAGTTFTVSGGQGTGTGAAGVVDIATAPAGSSGSAANALVTAARFDASTTATHTRMLIWDVDNGALERVTVGAADSGGAGFKLLRIAN